MFLIGLSAELEPETLGFPKPKIANFEERKDSTRTENKTVSTLL